MVLFGFDSTGKPEIGDPGVGREFWRPEDLRLLYQGYGLRLIGVDTPESVHPRKPVEYFSLE